MPPLRKKKEAPPGHPWNSPTDFTDPLGLESGAAFKNLHDNLLMTPLPPMEPFPEGNDRLSPYLHYPFDPYHWVPTHGNRCGPDWSGGQHRSLHGRKDGHLGPVDPLDALCKEHDAAYEPNAPESGHLPADIRLRDQAQNLPFDWNYFIYRDALVDAFSLRIYLSTH